MSTAEGHADSDLTVPNTPIGQIAPEDMPRWIRKHYDAVKDTIGDATSTGVFANHPGAYAMYMREVYPKMFFNTSEDMRVDHKYKELFRFKMGILHGCHLCNSFNWQTTLDVGYTREQLEHALEPTVGLFSDVEVAILELAECFVLTNQDPHLTPELHARLKQHIGDEGIVEMGVLGAFFMGWQRLLFAYDLVPREQACMLNPPMIATPSVIT
ncbi:MAG: carboxymuconolactone decarboxylase [Acidimicrobiales bacterium]|nr:carboxymuconolactone decarboxylase [Acidimicrobiales bacterium]